MNVTALARRLKVSTEELREILPKVGFDIGRKAIKIDDVQAHRIIRDWPRLKREWDFQQAKLRKQSEELNKTDKVEEKLIVQIPNQITVRDFSQIINKPVSVVIGQLMKNGIFASLNEQIDFETASIIADDLNIEAMEKEDDQNNLNTKEKTLQNILQGDSAELLEDRAPVIVVMGHVDHGKTLLLDSIRKTNIVSGEAGGITQSIGAYQVEKNGHKITFIDTPGHEAFTAMRSRGAQIADIAILVVAGDDSVKPQTIEALKIIENAKIPMIVAINKMDKEDANADKVKQDLSKYNILPEEWGGKIIMNEVSAMTGKGIDELLETILLLAETEKENIVANPNREAVGTIIESHIDRHEGPVATLLVQAGTLHLGDSLMNDGSYLGKVRAMRNWKNIDVKLAGPSMPVKILGFKTLPQVGDVLEIMEKSIKRNRKNTRKQHQALTYNRIAKQEDNNDNKQDVGVVFNMVIKADVLGMLEAIVESLEKIEQERVKIVILSKGLGNITENDINATNASNAFLVGFNVNATPQIKNLAQEVGVKIHFYKIIYKLIEDVKEKITEVIKPEIIRKDIGKIEVLATFQSGKDFQVVGGRVIDGEARVGLKADLFREDIKMIDGEITELQSGKQKVTVVQNGQECGLRFKGEPIIQVGDVLHLYEEEEKKIIL